MFLYAVSRYVIEIYRGDPRGVVPFLDISTSQFISLILGPLSLIMLLWLSRVLPTSPQETRHRRRAASEVPVAGNDTDGAADFVVPPEQRGQRLDLF
jgi:hypothetical protein